MRLIISHTICIKNGIRYANPNTAILIHLTSVVCMTPLASTDRCQSKMQIQKLKTSNTLIIHQKSMKFS